METPLLALLTQTVSIAPAGAVTVYGEHTPGTAVEMAARVQPTDELVTQPTGETVKATCVVYVDGHPAVTTDSVITMPDGSMPQILAIARHWDEYGDPHHTRIMT